MNGIIIILGAYNDEKGNLSSIGIERCSKVLRVYRENPGYKILPTGGYGDHFNTTGKPHAFYYEQYLIEHGIPADDILEYAESKNTIEDAQLTKPIIEKYRTVISVSTDWGGGWTAYQSLFDVLAESHAPWAEKMLDELANDPESGSARRFAKQALEKRKGAQLRNKRIESDK